MRQLGDAMGEALNSDGSSANSEKIAWAREAKLQAALLLGCYRTGDANDPEVYLAAIGAVLSDYPVPIQRTVCDPRTGLPSRASWLPTVAEVKSACNLERERLERIAKYSALPKAVVRLPASNWSRANILVPLDNPMYPAAVQASQDKKAMWDEWRSDNKGIYVTEEWALRNGAKVGWA